MKYTQLHELLKEHGIIFTLNIDPGILPYGHTANFIPVGAPDGFSVWVPNEVKALRSPTTHIHPDIITGQIWEELKKSHLMVLRIGFPSTIIQVQQDDTILVRTSDEVGQ